MKEKEYVVSCNEDQDEWYIVRRRTKDGALRPEILPSRYRTAEDATEAMVAIIEANR